jgi:hypothetical protein
MWPYTIGLAETRSKVSVTEVFLGAAPQAGEYALKDAPAGRLAFQSLMEVPDFGNPNGEAAVADIDSNPDATGIDPFLQVCGFLFAHLFEKPPTKSSVTQAIEAFVGSRRRSQPFYYITAPLDTATSRWLAREYWLDLLHGLVANRREMKKRLAGARNLVLEYVKRPVAETGSSAAIAKRMNPLGAPRKSHEGEIHGTCNERPE